jgi:hypothetical protein
LVIVKLFVSLPVGTVTFGGTGTADESLDESITTAPPAGLAGAGVFRVTVTGAMSPLERWSAPIPMLSGGDAASRTVVLRELPP